MTFRVTPKELSTPWVVSPLTPLTVDRASALLGAGDEAFFQAIQLPDLGSYTVTARVPLIGDPGGGLTQNRLRAAGTAYPAAIVARYTQLTADAVGPNAKIVLQNARQRLEGPNAVTPFDLAMALTAELGSDRFEYDRSVTEIQAQCGDVSIAECFATYKRGYCQHYATLMAVLLRHEGIPARVVEGYLPGDIDENTGIETLVNGSMHMWVEVYFPGIGWYLFDPTGPGVSEAPDLPTGRPVPSASPSVYPSLRPEGSDAAGPSHGAGTSAPTPPRAGPGVGGFIVITLVLLVSMATVSLIALRRRSRGGVTPEGAWAGIGRLAARFGFGPRPNETAFEYASALGDVLPEMRPDLEAVALARVEVTYGGRVLGDDRMQAIGAAYAKLRVGLLRLVVRHRERRR